MTIEQKVSIVEANEVVINGEISEQNADGFLVVSIILSNTDESVIILFQKATTGA